eukprot:8401973-Prorocentrum_lima.AAC.1
MSLPPQPRRKGGALRQVQDACEQLYREGTRSARSGAGFTLWLCHKGTNRHIQSQIPDAQHPCFSGEVEIT